MSTIFIIIGISMTDNNRLSSVFIIFFFGLCLLTFIVNLMPGASYLKIDDQGIAMKNLFRSTFIPWRSVSGFRTKNFFLNTMVVFDLNQDLPETSGMKVKTGAFPDTYGMSGKKLAALLNEQKERFDRV
ncbi:hypothetical protein CHA01nite_30820 [Chryseobacterium hagamense]|uniref:Low molecular weight protein antigen 6 PH domain-containing protein n=2 Tax=Chryseobacterium hagamense TaxID=395935 RepID=A0A511YQ71_9FLAO|nr:hypothetical protein CHA01nite_30820 [Chryseobacterium hagamense]